MTTTRTHRKRSWAEKLADSLSQLAQDHTTWQAFAKAGKVYAQANWEKDAIVERIEGALVKTAQGIDS